MAKEKKIKIPLKERNPRKFYQAGYFACIGGEWTCILAPIAAVFGAKWNEYFSIEDGNNVKMTIGSMLALLMAAIVVYKQVRHQEKMNNKVTLLSWVVGLGVAFVFSWLFKVVINDLFLILGSEFAGAAAAYGFDLGASNRLTHLKVYQTEVEQLKAQRFAEQEERRQYHPHD